MWVGRLGEGDGDGDGEQTTHEIRTINQPTPLLRVLVAQNAIIDEIPAEGVGDDDDESFGGHAVPRRSDVGREAVDGGFGAGGLEAGDAAREAG